MILLLCLLFTIQPVSSMTEEELFMQAFGKKMPKQQDEIVSTPVLHNDNEIGVVKVQTRKGKKYVDKKSLLENLKVILKPRIYSKYVKKFKKQKWILISTLKKQEIKFQYNERFLAYEINTELKYKQAEVHQVISQRRPRYHSIALDSANYSFFQNLRTRYLIDSGTGNSLSILGDGALNIKKTVLEYDWEYFSEEDASIFRRGEIRIVRDFPKYFLRSILGDINYSTMGRQVLRPLGGLEITNDYSMDPALQTFPTRSKEFVLRRDSDVDVWINGAQIHRMSLRAGAHKLEELPLFDGVNDVTLEIRDVTGKRSKIRFLQYGEFEMIRKGFHQYSYSFGVPRYFSEDSFEYAAGEEGLTYSFFHNYGVTNETNVGVHLQGDSLQKVFGGQYQVTGKFGKLSLEPSFSSVSTGLSDFAVDAYWSYLFYGSEKYFLRKFNFGIEKTGEFYAPLGTPSPNNTIDFSALGGYSHRINDDFSVSVSAKYSTTRDSDKFDMQSYSLGFNKVFLKNWNLNLTASYVKNDTGEDEIAAYSFLTFTLPEKNIFASAGTDTQNEITRVDVRYAKNSLTRGYEGFVGHQKNATGQTTSLGGKYNHFRFTGQLQHNIKQSDTAVVNAETNQTNILLSSAFLLADGKMTFSRPVDNSFVLVSKKEDLQGKEVIINQTLNGNEAEMKFFNTAPVTSVSPYSYRKIDIEVPELELDNSLENEEFYVFSNYKTGHLISIGKGNTYYVRGKVFKSKGKPHALKTGKLVRVDKKGQSVSFFTNRRGNYYIDGVMDGTYEMFFDGIKHRKLVLQLKKSKKAGGIVIKPLYLSK